jgi:hypothetical protein
MLSPTERLSFPEQGLEFIHAMNIAFQGSSLIVIDPA